MGHKRDHVTHVTHLNLVIWPMTHDLSSALDQMPISPGLSLTQSLRSRRSQFVNMSFKPSLDRVDETTESRLDVSWLSTSSFWCKPVSTVVSDPSVRPPIHFSHLSVTDAWPRSGCCEIKNQILQWRITRPLTHLHLIVFNPIDNRL